MAKEFNDSRVFYFFETVSCGTIRAAAEKHRIASSAVSRQISLLEEELGAVLIERRRKGVVLTEAGQYVINYYNQHRFLQKSLVSEIESLNSLYTGVLNIASGEGFSQSLLAGPILAFRKKYPLIKINLNFTSSTLIINQLINDQADVGLIYYADNHDQLLNRYSTNEPLYIMVGNQHPLRHLKQLNLQDLAKQPIALLEDSYGIQQLISTAESMRGIKLKPMFTTNLITTLIQFVATNQGVTILPYFTAQAEIANRSITPIKINDPVLNSAQVQLLTRIGKPLSPAATRFIDLCKQNLDFFKSPDS